MLDWEDILIHIAVGAGATGLLCALANIVGLSYLGWLAVAANAIAWPVREAFQQHAKGRPQPWDISKWSFQKHLEAWPPVFVGSLVGALVILT